MAAAYYHPFIHCHDYLWKGGVQSQKGLVIASIYLDPPLPVRLQAHCNLVVEASDEALVARGISARGDSHVDKLPPVHQY